MNKYRSRKNLPDELKALRHRMAQLLHANMGERMRTKELLRETELKLEERLGHMNSLETIWEISAKKFRKGLNPIELGGESNIQHRTFNTQHSIERAAVHLDGER